jgi:hypothetical protein
LNRKDYEENIREKECSDKKLMEECRDRELELSD